MFLELGSKLSNSSTNLNKSHINYEIQDNEIDKYVTDYDQYDNQYQQSYDNEDSTDISTITPSRKSKKLPVPQKKLKLPKAPTATTSSITSQMVSNNSNYLGNDHTLNDYNSVGGMSSSMYGQNNSNLDSNDYTSYLSRHHSICSEYDDKQYQSTAANGSAIGNHDYGLSHQNSYESYYKPDNSEYDQIMVTCTIITQSSNVVTTTATATRALRQLPSVKLSTVPTPFSSTVCNRSSYDTSVENESYYGHSIKSSINDYDDEDEYIAAGDISVNKIQTNNYDLEYNVTSSTPYDSQNYSSSLSYNNQNYNNCDTVNKTIPYLSENNKNSEYITSEIDKPSTYYSDSVTSKTIGSSSTALQNSSLSSPPALISSSAVTTTVPSSTSIFSSMQSYFTSGSNNSYADKNNATSNHVVDHNVNNWNNKSSMPTTIINNTTNTSSSATTNVVTSLYETTSITKTLPSQPVNNYDVYIIFLNFSLIK